MKQLVLNSYRPALRFLITLLVAITLTAVVSAPSAFAESAATPGVVFLELSAERILTQQAERLSDFPTQRDTVSVVESGSAPNVVGLARWVVPRFIVDTRTTFDETTLWAIRNEDNVQVVVNITYTDLDGAELLVETDLLDVRQTITRNLEHLGALTASAQDRVIGSIWFAARRVVDLSAEDGRISIDTFTVDSVGNFASGGLAHSIKTPCRFWSVRFLNFGDGPSAIDILTDALGGSLLDPVTVDVTLYEEDGSPLGGYGVFSAHDVFEIDISATTTSSFGVVELDFGPGRSGVVSVRHSAFGRFSVGHEAFCAD